MKARPLFELPETIYPKTKPNVRSFNSVKPLRKPLPAFYYQPEAPFPCYKHQPQVPIHFHFNLVSQLARPISSSTVCL